MKNYLVKLFRDHFYTFFKYSVVGVSGTLVDLGAQIDFKLVIFSTMSSTFSLGYAGAWEKDSPYRDELMISLKIQ